MLEAVILSTSYAFIAVGKKEGRKSAILLGRLKKNVDRPLAAILTLNTIANTLGATGIGAQVQIMYGSEALALSSALLTITILIFSEIIPKTLGALYWKKLTPIAAYLIQAMIFLTYPFVLLSELISSFISRGDKPKNTSREEMIMTAELGADEGSIKRNESTIIRNLLMLNNIYVSDIMTPRSVFLAIEADLTVADVMKTYRPIRFSRIPVFEDSLDFIIGMVHRYQIVEASANDHHSKKIQDFVTPIHAVPETISVAAALDQFIKRREHIFLCIDEYGVTSGLVSLEDAVETLLGVEIVDEFDSVEDMRKFALDQWKQRKSEMRNFTSKD